jgi:hypothetical protein
MSYDARICVGGIGRRAKILTREPFSDFILAYVGVSGNAR